MIRGKCGTESGIDTMMSHGETSCETKYLTTKARQLGLKCDELVRLVKRPLSREEYEKLLRGRGSTRCWTRAAARPQAQPRLTLRITTERPVTVAEGTKRVIDHNEAAAIAGAVRGSPPRSFKKWRVS